MAKPKFASVKRENNVFEGFDRVRPKLSINVGCLLDIVTGNIIEGVKGDTIINGGLSNVTGFVGVGNNYKSTIMHYVMLSAADKIKQATLPLEMQTYDTETNADIERLQSLSGKFKHINKEPITGFNPEWFITNKSLEDGNVWAMKIEESLKKKSLDKNERISVNFIKDPYTKEDFELIIPTFVEIDSFTEFEGSSSFEVLSKDLDGSETKTYALNQGSFKTKFMSRLPITSTKSNTYFLLTAHVGGKVDMNANPYAPQETKKLQYLKANESIKGTGSKFTFLTTQAFHLNGAKPLVNQSTKLPEFPLDDKDGFTNDLNIVNLTILRNKNGVSGGKIDIIVSQNQGVLPSLTEFYYIKTNKFGISGNDRSYYLDIYPDVKLSRTTVRKLLDTDPLLRRAVNITSEILQLKEFKAEYLREQKERYGEDIWCTPAELYEDIIKLGYNWNDILNKRGYYLLDQYENEVPYLSSIDLLKIRKGLYTPYYLKK